MARLFVCDARRVENRRRAQWTKCGEATGDVRPGCLGFRALATDGGTFDGGDSRFWVDALFRPEPWRIYCSRQTRDPILCAATFPPRKRSGRC